jgi:hypothetical protein
MAKFVVEEVIDDGEDGAAIWDRLRQYVIKRQSVELIRRKIDGQHVIEVRRWKGVRGSGSDSNRVDASPTKDY